MRFLHIVLAASLASALASCGPSNSYRYRVTVDVDTRQGVRSGSSVWETTAWKGSGIPDRGIRARLRGEAVAVDLSGGTLFAVMRGRDLDGDYGKGIVVGHLKKHPELGVPMGADWMANRRLIEKAKPSFDLDPDEYPLMVRFTDPNDPRSVERVGPNDLSAFGSWNAIRRIHIEVTTDRPVAQILDRLPWLKTHMGALKPPPPNVPVDEHPFASRINDGDFKR
jgi:hypothetical protein